MPCLVRVIHQIGSPERDSFGAFHICSRLELTQLFCATTMEHVNGVQSRMQTKRTLGLFRRFARPEIKRGLIVVLLGFCVSFLLGSGDDPDWKLDGFVRPSKAAPVIMPRPESSFLEHSGARAVAWETLHTFNPAAVVRDGKIYVLYRAEDDSGENKIGGHTSRIGLAESEDGIHFQRDSRPVLFPADDAEKERERNGGCEDPRIVEAEDGTYVMTYTQWNHATYDAAAATSKDLRHWEKRGPLFAKASAGKYKDLQYKSAGIVTHLKSGKLVAAKIAGEYWMYWGEGEIHLATSENLTDWKPLEGENGKPVTVLAKRERLFDSKFPEVGAPPILTSRGIVMLYNGKNAETGGDKELSPASYSVGEALFAADNPARLLARTDQPIFKPELSFEQSGQYVAGTTFAEGLVYFNQKWFLYYGCADSFVGVAVRSKGTSWP